MRRFAIALAATIALPLPALADNPITEFFRYDGPPTPHARDCGELAASRGSNAIWFGEFSGKRFDDFSDKYQPYAARGCFESGEACQIWQGQEISVANGGPIYYATCRRGRP